MADLGESLRGYLATRSALTALVQTGNDLRITTDALPQGEALPAIAFYSISDVSHENLRGGQGIATRRYQFDCFAATRRAANAVREELRLALQGFRGQMGTHRVRGATVVSRSDEYEPPNDGSDEARYVARIEFFVTYDESPTWAGV